MNRMFVIYGCVNSGKTHTAWMVLNHLLAMGAELSWIKKGVKRYSLEEILNHPELVNDFRVLLTYKGLRIAFWSNGDYLKDFKYDIDWAAKQGVDYVICSSRSRNRENSVYHELMTNYRGRILADDDWFWVERTSSAAWLQEKDILATRIAQRIITALD